MSRQGNDRIEPQLVGSSRAMRSVRAQLARLADLPFSVRIEGPTGSGKGIAARLLHHWSFRCDGPFVPCNVNVMAEGLEVAELVGYVRGAFTGAVMDQIGAFEAAHGGTLFLDEIAAASPRVQRALLQLLEDRLVRRLGEQRPRRVDVRLVYATNQDLERALLLGEFRRDLYYRLGALVIRMPALSEHREDIPELVERILEHKVREANVPMPHLSPREMARLLAYEWPGNVRQLDHAMEHYIAFGKLPEAVLRAPRSRDWRERLDEVLQRHGGNKTAAAGELGISRKTLHEELKCRKAQS